MRNSAHVENAAVATVFSLKNPKTVGLFKPISTALLRVHCALTEILPSVVEFLTRDLGQESLSGTAEQKRREYVDIIQTIKHDDQRYVAPAAAAAAAAAALDGNITYSSEKRMTNSDSFCTRTAGNQTKVPRTSTLIIFNRP